MIQSGTKQSGHGEMFTTPMVVLPQQLREGSSGEHQPETMDMSPCLETAASAAGPKAQAIAIKATASATL